MDIAHLKLDLVQRLLANSDETFLAKLRAIVLHKERSGNLREQEIEDMIASSSVFGSVAYGEDEPDISGITLQEPNPDYKPWKPEK